MAADLQDGRDQALIDAAAGTPLGPLEDIPDGQAKGFVLGAGSRRLEVFVVRRGARLYGYENACPHAGTPLDWTPDRFMSACGRFIQCATHGARFRIEDGVCVSGPCPGKALRRVALGLDAEGRIRLGVS